MFFTKSKILLLYSFVLLYIIGFGDAEEEKKIVSARIEVNIHALDVFSCLI